MCQYFDRVAVDDVTWSALVPDDVISQSRGLIESNTTMREGRGNPIRVSKICNPRRGLPSVDGIPESLPQCGDWLFFSFLTKKVQNMSKRTLDATFLDCLALTFCDVIVELLPERDYLTLQGGRHFSWHQNWRIFQSQEWEKLIMSRT